MSRRAPLIFAAAALFAVLALALLPRTHESSYKGIPLAQWLNDSRTSDDPQVREAIVIITSNSMPLLIRWLSLDTTPRSRLEGKLPQFMLKNLLIHKFIYRWSNYKYS